MIMALNQILLLTYLKQKPG